MYTLWFREVSGFSSLNNFENQTTVCRDIAYSQVGYFVFSHPVDGCGRKRWEKQSFKTRVENVWKMSTTSLQYLLNSLLALVLLLLLFNLFHWGIFSFVVCCKSSYLVAVNHIFLFRRHQPCANCPWVYNTLLDILYSIIQFKTEWLCQSWVASCHAIILYYLQFFMRSFYTYVHHYKHKCFVFLCFIELISTESEINWCSWCTF